MLFLKMDGVLLMVAGSKRRKIEDTKPLDLNAVALKLYDMPPRDSCLVALLYLSGRRIGEVLELKKKDFKVEHNRISFETFNEKVFRQKQTGAYTILREGLHYTVDPKTRERTEYNQAYYEKIRPHFRTDNPHGRMLSEFITNRLSSLSDNDFLFQKQRGEAKPIGYSMAYAIVRFYFPGIWPHLLRHERFTEIFRVYKDDLMGAHEFTFHKRFESNRPYIRPLEEEKERI
jgi:integrase